jgi:hypothetical protein
MLLNQYWINPLHAELNPICHLLALLAAHHILHVSSIGIKPFFLPDLLWFLTHKTVIITGPEMQFPLTRPDQSAL